MLLLPETVSKLYGWIFYICGYTLVPVCELNGNDLWD